VYEHTNAQTILLLLSRSCSTTLLNVCLLCAVNLQKQSKVMKKLECWNAGTYVCYKEQIDRWTSLQHSKADKLWVQYLNMIESINSIKSAYHKTVFIDISVDVEYLYLLLSNCLDTADGHDYNEAVKPTETEQNKIAFIDKTVDPVYYYAFKQSCLANESGREYSVAVDDRDTVDKITKVIDADVHQKVKDTSITVDDKLAITSHKSNESTTNLVSVHCASTNIHDLYSLLCKYTSD
jgi:hypothetical protein